jgi:Tol biopolymer transport system component
MLILLLALGVGAVVISAVSWSSGEETSAQGYEVVRLTTLTTKGGRVDWSPDGEWIAYDRRGPDGFWDVYRVHLDGTGNECFTCDMPALPNRHQGNPAYHPSGRWLVFQAEQPYHYADSIHWPCEPGRGIYNELWLLDLEAGAFHKLNTVNNRPPAGGSLHPQFSRDGTKLLWGDFQGGRGGEFGDWRIAVADFVTTPVPHLENITYYEPGERKIWYETHGWSLDDSKILFTAATLSGQNDLAMDIYWMDLSTEELIRLTESSGRGGEPAEWDEHAHLSPLGGVIAWMSSNGYGIDPDPDAPVTDWLRCELWLMNADGSDKRRVTYFNEPGHPEFAGGRAVVSDLAWSPDGTRVVMRVQFPESGERDQIWIVEFSVASSSES